MPIVPYARIGGAEGLRLARAAFAPILKFSDLIDQFSELVDEVDLIWNELDGYEDRDIKIKEAIKKSTHYELIIKRWDSASKMRKWASDFKVELEDQLMAEITKENPEMPDEERKTIVEEK